jgi:hypothetical protein
MAGTHDAPVGLQNTGAFGNPLTGSPQLGHRFHRRKEAKSEQVFGERQMSRSSTVSYELVRLPKHSLELSRQKAKIKKQRGEIDKLKLAVKTHKAIVAKAKAKGFVS